MDSLIKPFFSLLLFFFSSLLFGVASSNQHHLYGPEKLFVFGDSYADTGNIKKPHAVSWRVPYGISFPGKPPGRFSDGLVSTDFLAILLRIQSPIPYLWKDYAGNKRLRYGMNFAYGGTGVFNTQSSSPNMSIQIKYAGAWSNSQVVAKLNNETNHSAFAIIDFYNAFLTIFKNKGENPGSTRFETPLKPCCEGSCANVDEKGEKKYSLCDDPKSAFFWDGLHPTQQGWESVYSVLGKTLTASLIKP
ncbi:unnamed protein product [Thlaspi arvense]|uniref:GDSL esterase/lipase n=1 Tax=Thlaspi arvense TaxID=13288 RepID=A0AAU9T013_THLAR|nr:unnamed protein product [Thlaspi arvense]